MSKSTRRLLWHRKLAALGPCGEAMKFALRYSTLAAAWKACKRGDWMKWLIVHVRWAHHDYSVTYPNGFYDAYSRASANNYVPADYNAVRADVVRKFYPQAPRLPALKVRKGKHV